MTKESVEERLQRLPNLMKHLMRKQHISAIAVEAADSILKER